MLYVGAVLSLVVFRGFFGMRRATKLRHLLFMSLFFVLSMPLMRFLFIYMAHYGFYLLSDPQDSPVPISSWRWPLLCLWRWSLVVQQH